MLILEKKAENYFHWQVSQEVRGENTKPKSK